MISKEEALQRNYLDDPWIKVHPLLLEQAPQAEKLGRILNEVAKELSTAQRAFPPMNSYHEGYAILLEEVDELWAEIKPKPARRDKDAIRREAVQVAAMALRFLHDLT